MNTAYEFVKLESSRCILMHVEACRTKACGIHPSDRMETKELRRLASFKYLRVSSLLLAEQPLSGS